ncbi:16S rRNA (uracil(1498)-N(3))-methyltransferase [Desulfovibrio ferrophilus]|uniref:Ribosomal RNA small subunit methyltransferase E n=1 Tax=Desulfovibrio ferrophilus TaxID=241368 RepID=A0A2Z6AWP7_9BACT|nr:16S rRNA (uracil(1498)-N(3))-methyltransferase [Desulfovibrio ferrophilus]BBD07640.1 ribosomal RNA small subunit methyltransferase E [Desulfovibrio ferrophilus]
MKTFFLDSESWCEPYALTGQEAHHLSRVLRLGPGAEVHLIDGVGHEGTFRVDSVTKSRVSLTPLSLSEVSPQSPRIVLAMGWTKGLRRGWLLEKAVELRAGGLWFWQAEHSQGRVPNAPKETWSGKLLAGAKQCGNPLLPELKTLPGGVSELIQAGKNFERTYLLHEDRTAGAPLSPAEVTASGDALCVLGPEGGFAPSEAQALMDAGFTPISLGPSILRWETAALTTLSLFWWGGQHA